MTERKTLYNYEDTNTRIRTMGFLLGAFGKLQAGARRRQLQAQLMSVQTRLRRASRQVQNMENMLNRQEKSMQNAITMQSQIASNNAQQSLWSSNMSAYDGKDASQLSKEEQAAYSTAQARFNQQFSQVNTSIQMQAAMQKEQITQYFEQVRETQLQALKDEEDLLQSEKDSLETQLQIADADYKACQDMEKQDAQMLKPNYTGGGQ